MTSNEVEEALPLNGVIALVLKGFFTNIGEKIYYSKTLYDKLKNILDISLQAELNYWKRHDSPHY